jgi:hypothetical protein
MSGVLQSVTKNFPKNLLIETEKVKAETKATVSKDNLLKGDPYYKKGVQFWICVLKMKKKQLI